jgi:hypothetical protein
MNRPPIFASADPADRHPVPWYGEHLPRRYVVLSPHGAVWHTDVPFPTDRILIDQEA